MRARALLAFDASSVSGAVVARTFGGRRLRGFSRAPLPSGALVPSATEPNVLGPDDVRQAIARVAEDAGFGRAPVTVLAPPGVARLALVEPPAGVEAADFARFKMSALPYPAAEAVLDVLPAEGGRAVAAAVRRSVVEGYEAAVAAAGLAQERFDLAALAALAALLGAPGGDDAVVDLVLGDVGLAIAAHRAGVPLAVRQRRRDRRDGEGDRLRVEVERTASLAGVAPGRVRVVGPGSRALIREWSSQGLAVVAGWEAEGRGVPSDAAELPWLGAALA